MYDNKMYKRDVTCSWTPSPDRKLSHLLGPPPPRVWRTLWTAPGKTDPTRLEVLKSTQADLFGSTPRSTSLYQPPVTYYTNQLPTEPYKSMHHDLPPDFRAFIISHHHLPYAPQPNIPVTFRLNASLGP